MVVATVAHLGCGLKESSPAVWRCYVTPSYDRVGTEQYLICQLIPGLITLGIGLYIQTRPVKKRELNVFSLLMFGGAVWAFTNAVQLITPHLGWQKAWNTLTYLGIMSIPTAWFLLSVKLTGIGRDRVEKAETWLWFIPALLYLSLLTNGYHNLFFISTQVVIVGGYAILENGFGPLFFVHTGYSYLLMVSGIVILAVSLVMDFKRYGIQAYALIIGVLAPLLGNAYYLFGAPPPGFPDPTPIIFTVTGLAFAWAIFGGRLLIDGAACDPLPVDVAIQDSAGIIIAMGFTLDYRARLRSMTAVQEQLNSIYMNNILTSTFAFYNLAHHAEIFPILPEFGEPVSMFDVDKIPQVVERGEQATRQQLPHIRRALASLEL